MMDNPHNSGAPDSGYATRLELEQLRGDMREAFATLRGEMNTGFATLRGEMNGLRGEMNTGFAALRGELSAELGDGLRNNLRWTVTTIIAGLAVALVIAKFLFHG